MGDTYLPTQLDIKAGEFAEEYFDDMMLKRGSCVEDYILLTYVDGQKEYALPYEWEWQLDPNNYRYIVGKLEDGVSGITNNIEHMVTIDPDYEDDDIVLLHEMIHVFCGLYAYSGDPPIYQGDSKVEPALMPFIRDALLLCLYNHLLAEIPRLDKMILAHANVHSGEDIMVHGGNHDILFFLKSLDLDLRLKTKLGTVCGYGREEYISSIIEDKNEE